MKLINKLILITGASKGIGKEIAISFAEEGANLILVARNSNDLQVLKDKLNNDYPNSRILIFNIDLSSEQGVSDLFKSIKENEIDNLDVVVNNAGIMIDFTLQQQKISKVFEMFNINLFSVMMICQYSLKFFLKKRKGCIINISSIIGTEGAAGQSAYSASKAAIIGFSKSLSKELARVNIKVNVIAPGFIETEMTNKYSNEQQEAILSTIGMRRKGTPKDVSKLALFLASDDSNYITGQVIGIDGGMLI